MSQAPFHISSLSMMLFGLSAIIDTGKHDDISFDEVKRHAHDGDLIEFLNNRTGFKFASGFCEAAPEFARWYVKKLSDLCVAMDGRERRKYGVENSGLCLLVSFTAEIIQQGHDIRLS